MRAFSPLDEELGLLPGPWTPTLHEETVRLATWMPFGKAATLTGWFRHVDVSEATVRRLTEAAGAACVAQEVATVEQLERERPVPPAGPAVQQVSVDGAMVPLVHGEWAEVKTLAVGTVTTAANGAAETTELSYFSRLADSERFTREALGELHRRGTERAGVVCFIVDGAEWEQKFIEVHHPGAVKILDWGHAAEYVARAGQAAFGAGTAAASEWIAQQWHELRHGEPNTVLAELRRLRDAVLLPADDPAAVAPGTVARLTAPAETTPLAAPAAVLLAADPVALAVAAAPAGTGPVEAGAPMPAAVAVLTTSLTYLEKRADQIRYAEFAAQGFPIGSGAVESANKLVVEVRLKGSGMHWAVPHVDPMVALRAVECSDRWDAVWPLIVATLRQEHRRRMRTRRRARRPSPPVSEPSVCGVRRADRCTPPSRRRRSTPAAPRRPAASAVRPVPATETVARTPWRPAPDHPWRKPLFPNRAAKTACPPGSTEI